MDAERSPLLAGRSILARRMRAGGREYSMHIAEIDDDGRISVRPFEAETHSTLYISEPVEIEAELTPEGWRLLAYAAR